MSARRYPRTCDDAFGPYQRSSQCVVESMPDPFPREDVIVMVACAVACVALIVIFTLEYFA